MLSPFPYPLNLSGPPTTPPSASANFWSHLPPCTAPFFWLSLSPKFYPEFVFLSASVCSRALECLMIKFVLGWLLWFEWRSWTGIRGRDKRGLKGGVGMFSDRRFCTSEIFYGKVGQLIGRLDHKKTFPSNWCRGAFFHPTTYRENFTHNSTPSLAVSFSEYVKCFGCCIWSFSVHLSLSRVFFSCNFPSARLSSGRCWTPASIPHLFRTLPHISPCNPCYLRDICTRLHSQILN